MRKCEEERGTQNHVKFLPSCLTENLEFSSIQLSQTGREEEGEELTTEYSYGLVGHFS